MGGGSEVDWWLFFVQYAVFCKLFFPADYPSPSVPPSLEANLETFRFKATHFLSFSFLFFSSTFCVIWCLVMKVHRPCQCRLGAV